MTAVDHDFRPQTGDDSTRVVVRGVSKTYRTRRGSHLALDDVSLEVGQGEFVVLLGPSGCGKTTLLRCISGLEEPDSGEIIIDGKVVFSSERRISVPPESRDLNMVFQSYALWPHLSVLDNVAYPLRSRRIARRESRSRAEEALGLVGLGEYGCRYPGQLSGGQQQRVALARAIVSRNGLVLFDEPLSNLDAKVRDRLRVELLTLQRRIGFSAIYVTHDQTEALALADRVAVMGVGEIVQMGTATEIYDLPATHYVAEFVGAANELKGRVKSVDRGLSVETGIGVISGVEGRGPMTEGRDVCVMVRPEHCSIDAHSVDAAHNSFEGVVVRSIYLGSMVQHLVRVGEEILTVSVAGGPILEPDSQVTLSFAVDRSRIFAE